MLNQHGTVSGQTNPVIPGNAQLVSFEWTERGKTEDQWFYIHRPGKEKQAMLGCQFIYQKNGRHVDIGRYTAKIPVPTNHWEKLENFLRRRKLPAYNDPQEVSDTVMSRVSVTWLTDAGEIAGTYDGSKICGLRVLVQDLAWESYCFIPTSVDKPMTQNFSFHSAPAVTAGWICSCGQTGNTGKFCPECGKPFDDGDIV